MKRTRFLMIGGFLGAGKTTAIGRAARTLMQQGLKVGLVTNDQAYALVDTETFRQQGFPVGEVAGACFCCKFDDLVETLGQLAQADQPDVIIAEPVGSCTDLVATVVEPLKQLYPDQYELGTYAVLAKPEHGRKILGGQEAGFSPKAAYIFQKQLEEADLIAINKVDKLSAEEQSELVTLVQKHYPDKEVLAISARRGDHFEQLLEVLNRVEPAKHFTPELDYDIYAEGEAELGWLNCRVAVQATAPFALDELVLDVTRRLQEFVADEGAETAHLKIYGSAESDAAIANAVASDEPPELSVASEIKTDQAELIVNARVAVAPERLEAGVRKVVAAVQAKDGWEAEIEDLQRFRPGRPVPTHRMPVSD